jgi:hypothetical protein
MTQGKLNQNTEGLLDYTENIRVVIIENLLHQQKLKCLRWSSHLHLQKRLIWKKLYSPNKGSLRSSKAMKIVRTVTIKVNHHPKCLFGFHQTYPQELKSYLMQ